MNIQKFKTNELICNENSAGDKMYLIKSGKVRVFKTINAEKVTLSTFGKNEFFGEMSILLNKNRTASVEALEDTEIIEFDIESLLERIKEEPEFALDLITMLAKRIDEVHKIISETKGEIKSLKIIYGNK